MARYDHLSIYREAFDLALYFERMVRGMARYDKYTLGADLRNLSREILRLIQRANSLEDRIETLRQVRAKAEELKVVLRLARESGAISKASSYEHAAGKVVTIARQNEGWLSYLLEAARREGVGRIVIVGETEPSVGPIIPRLPVAVGIRPASPRPPQPSGGARLS